MTPDKYTPEIYSPVEQQRIKDLREKISNLELSDSLREDAHLIRWLRARNLDVPKAYDMLKKSLEWRRENKIDGILDREDIPDEVKQMTPFARCGLDKHGYPVIIVPAGRQDIRTLLEQHGGDNCLRYNTITCEKMMRMLRELSEEQGREVTQIVEIIDLEGYSYRQLTSKLCRDFMVRMQTTFDANYPEMLHYAMVINAPKIFYILFNIMKPFIPKQTLEKVDIYGPEPEKWKKVIAEKFPVDSIPPHWGGTMEGSDQFCSQNGIWVQGPVPIHFFTQDESMTVEDLNMTSVTINARDLLKIDLNVTKYNSSIAWRFRSQSHDIGFQIVFETGEVIVPSVKTQKYDGTHACDALGTYTVIFDNSYSLMRGKTISYCVSVIEPDEVNSNYEGLQTTNHPITVTS